MSGNLAKTHILHFCTLQIQYHIWGVPNFFFLVHFKVFFTILSQRIYRRKKIPTLSFLI